jgi:predicted DNA-binding transcriptional regulator AlpA
MEIETNSSSGNVVRKQLAPATVKLLNPKEAAQLLNVSVSWLAKARMRGDGPPFIKIGRNARYSEAVLLQWMRAHQRLSTSEQ